ncbi:MAG: hypothetical protein CL912_09460 [Deltaproteobacteria bacterium]|mgnify:CR=1|nr:hypothetical protein [Deltaproteobacteria bacterium]|tara:strand:+ start:776 stop:985 length:210 start_codon:yes stop_codon:yes gene_type:complete
MQAWLQTILRSSRAIFGNKVNFFGCSLKTVVLEDETAVGEVDDEVEVEAMLFEFSVLRGGLMRLEEAAS